MTAGSFPAAGRSSAALRHGVRSRSVKKWLSVHPNTAEANDRARHLQPEMMWDTAWKTYLRPAAGVRVGTSTGGLTIPNDAPAPCR